MESTGRENIVSEWLHSLGLGKYSSAFYDNGYDELELCKQIEQEDLNAIGVFNPLHRKILQDSVRTLRSEGATAVYFTLEEVNKQNKTKRMAAPPESSGKTTNVQGIREEIYDVSPRSRHSHSRPAPIMASHPNLSAELHNHNGYEDLKRVVIQRLSTENVDITKSPYTLPVSILT